MNIKDFIYNYETDEIPNEYLFERLRIWRNEELIKSDWTQLEDAQIDKTVWAKYRQALRDLPNQNEDPYKLKFPKKP